MKKLILIGLLIIYGCDRKDSGVEIIPDYDAIYLPSSQVDVPTEILGDENKHLEAIETIIGEHFAPKNQAFYFFRVREIKSLKFIVIEWLKNRRWYVFDNLTACGTCFFQNNNTICFMKYLPF